MESGHGTGVGRARQACVEQRRAIGPGAARTRESGCTRKSSRRPAQSGNLSRCAQSGDDPQTGSDPRPMASVRGFKHYGYLPSDRRKRGPRPGLSPAICLAASPAGPAGLDMPLLTHSSKPITHLEFRVYSVCLAGRPAAPQQRGDRGRAGCRNSRQAGRAHFRCRKPGLWPGCGPWPQADLSFRYVPHTAAAARPAPPRSVSTCSVEPPPLPCRSRSGQAGTDRGPRTASLQEHENATIHFHGPRPNQPSAGSRSALPPLQEPEGVGHGPQDPPVPRRRLAPHRRRHLLRREARPRGRRGQHLPHTAASVTLRFLGGPRQIRRPVIQADHGCALKMNSPSSRQSGP
jgi:hypothetical protein